MELAAYDIAAFVAFIAAVIGVSLYASRKEDTTEDYFLAGRKLTWWLIGFSLIASNISTEHFVVRLVERPRGSRRVGSELAGQRLTV